MGGRVRPDIFGYRSFFKFLLNAKCCFYTFIARRVRRQKSHLFDLSDRDACQLDLSRRMQSVGADKTSLEPHFFLERVKIAGRVKYQKAKYQQPGEHKNTYSQLSDGKVFSALGHNYFPRMNLWM